MCNSGVASNDSGRETRMREDPIERDALIEAPPGAGVVTGAHGRTWIPRGETYRLRNALEKGGKTR